MEVTIYEFYAMNFTKEYVESLSQKECERLYKEEAKSGAMFKATGELQELLNDDMVAPHHFWCRVFYK